MIIAEDVDSEPLAALILNKLKGALRVCCVKAPGFGSGRKNQLDDIGILTKSQILDPDLGMTFENSEVGIMGTAKKVIVGKEETVIIHGQGNKQAIQERVQSIR